MIRKTFPCYDVIIVKYDEKRVPFVRFASFVAFLKCKYPDPFKTVIKLTSDQTMNVIQFSSHFSLFLDVGLI